MVLRGKVTKGKMRGKALGFPTANIPLHRQIPEGIYISLAKAGKKAYKSLTFIGIAHTFNEKEYKAEVHLFNFSGVLYGKWLSVTLIKKIRDNKRFSSTEELVFAMQQDKKEAIAFFASKQFH